MVSRYLIFLVLLLSAYADEQCNDRILLQNVQTLTLRSGRMVNARRVESIPELTRIGGSAPSHVLLDRVQCYNTGTDSYGEVQWRCEAEMPNPGYSLGEVEVVCEGYWDSEDTHVLRGSCGLEYELNGSPQNTAAATTTVYHETTSSSLDSSANILLTFFVLIIMFAMLGGFLELCLRRRSSHTTVVHTSPAPATVVQTPAPLPPAPPPPAVVPAATVVHSAVPAPAVVHHHTAPAPTVIHTSPAPVRYYSDGGGFLSGYLWGSAMSSGPTTRTVHHHHGSSGGGGAVRQRTTSTVVSGTSSSAGPKVSKSFGGTRKR